MRCISEKESTLDSEGILNVFTTLLQQIFEYITDKLEEKCF